ncbi:hypothetical protein ACFVFS_24675 [Kitasatospora sp. NPDC057692]|uniref:hypothetical protein n=1 Tax=Kitasatospora sp. NPDC057692 TaxID=3346215 RepID=UPI0036C91562
MSSLITAITEHAEAADFLSWPGDFDLDRTEHVEEVHLASGAALEGFAADGAGGSFFFCGDGGEERPILYADSEGQAGLVAIGLPELLRLLLVVPWWRDCPGFSAAESTAAAAVHLADLPDLAERRDRAAAALGLVLPSEAEALARLREVALGPVASEFVLVFTPEDTPYESLFTD